MSSEKHIQEKTRLHIRNKNREKYDLEALAIAVPELSEHIKPNKYGENSVDFANPVAVKLLNKALLKHYYGIENWDFPGGNLCPPIPGRADYLHYIADLLTQSNFGTLPPNDHITVLDIGVGANCIYPILGVTEYGWNFIGSDINTDSMEAAKKIAGSNDSLKNKIQFRLQGNSECIFQGIIHEGEKIDLTVCNPPFYSSTEEAQKTSRRKVQNLTRKKVKKVELNFAGIAEELICAGGEHTFLHKMITESKEFAENCYWFSTLVSKESNLKGVYKALGAAEATQIKTIPTGTGNKSSRIVAWSFLSRKEQTEWREERWKISK